MTEKELEKLKEDLSKLTDEEFLEALLEIRRKRDQAKESQGGK